MARSDPTRSDYCATRHLLRNLNDARRLRRNPLAADALAHGEDAAALRVIGDRVSRTFAEMDDARCVSILLRVDVERHEPEQVAADLGLSARQFHRVRRKAHDHFLRAYRLFEPARVELTVAHDLQDRLLERAGALADSGEAASAQAILVDLAGNADAEARIEALIQLAEVDSWAHRFDRAQAHLRDAHALLARSEFAGERGDRIRDAYEAAQLRARWFVHGPSALANGNGHTYGPRSSLIRAAALLRAGDAQHAAALVERTDFDQPALDHASEVDLLLLRGEMADFTAEDPLLSEHLFGLAIETAQAYGLHGREIYAMHQLQITRWAHTRSAADRSAYRALADRIDRSMAARLRSYLVFSAADIELAIGSPQRALEMSKAAVSVSTNAYESMSATGLAAGALLRLGRVAEAAAQAGADAQAGRSAGFARIVSLAQRINAQALLAEGNRRAARIAIEESIECARHFSSAHVLAQAQAVLARITGKLRSKDLPI